MLKGMSATPPARQKQILITGYPRSGTTLLYNMLCASLASFSFEYGEVPAASSIWKRGNRVTKRPFDIFDIKQIVAKNIHHKELIVVILVRDVRDIITSFHPFGPGTYMIGFEGCYLFRGNYPDYQKCFEGPGIGQFYRAIKACESMVDLKVLALRYEDLILEMPKAQSHLAHELGVEFSMPFGEYHKHTERHGIKYEGKRAALDPALVKTDKPVTKAYVGRWKHLDHAGRIQAQFTKYPDLFAILQEYGYESDNVWFERYRV
jgi:hypothetical protein